ncbi:MAG: GTPase ObgE [Chlamydiae bacterium CG10_big_fil_rev_8_21_14_0_10_42_34]|nr:MAG: GTPase ObgE [Chlamydiae bacterium CG10_big_fil_rev_8_21_14_0_10_42_34]
MFVDTVSLSLSAGKGGNGVIAWRREKYIPKGGPAGGDGGNGGSVYLKADEQVHSLEDYRNRRIIKAQNGAPGGANNRKGKNGLDLYLKIPVGTLVKDAKTGEVLYDFTEKGQTWKICAGGIGGKGNSRFKTSTHQAPFVCTDGTAGKNAEIELELKLIADIGFVGMPNAGKSTLISKLAYIQVKIAPYPFTTLRPNLGIVEFDDFSRILIADIPGIIENAHANKGLGFAFLRHIERTSSITYLIELAPHQDRDCFEEFLMLRRELEAYNPEMLQKPFCVVLNKIDQEGARELADAFKEKYPYDPTTLFEISALEGINVAPLRDHLQSLTAKVYF